jgi:hypothetical protein
MRFQYVQEDDDEDNDNNNHNNITNNSVNYNHHGDDTSTIATEHYEKQQHNASSLLGAHVFCGNCGVHVMHADRSSEELEVNANCLLKDEEEEEDQEQQTSLSSSPIKEQQQQKQIRQQTSSMSSLSTIDGEMTNDPTTSTRQLQQQQQQQQQPLNSVSEHELFLGSAQFWGTLDNINKQSNDATKNSGIDNTTKPTHELFENSSQHHHTRTESISSMGEQTHPESYTTMLDDTPTYEGDDYSMDDVGGGGIGGASSSTSLSVTAATGLLPPLPPSSSGSRLPPPPPLSSDSRSVRTLPPWFGERPGYAPHASRSVGGGGWSVTSMETNDLDSVGGGGESSSTTVSPRMRDQMKFYMSRHMNNKKKSEKSG